ncbi:hypothetical protein N7510_009163 [Penicillium lagena]|uniref:uncharacterized protein n=1 Tax=Penicillium lagena TaxID=94218 RepID=UPI00253FCAD8|nr:uncharacterized protein N7510_009163 [Penicillium lagena]KAJ5606382.1 hypothetical protein N7510_009163 [Penicillium lagena]
MTQSLPFLTLAYRRAVAPGSTLKASPAWPDGPGEKSGTHPSRGRWDNLALGTTPNLYIRCEQMTSGLASRTEFVARGRPPRLAESPSLSPPGGELRTRSPPVASGWTQTKTARGEMSAGSFSRTLPILPAFSLLVDPTRVSFFLPGQESTRWLTAFPILPAAV